MKKKAIIILAVACMGMGLLACGKEHIDKESEIRGVYTGKETQGRSTGIKKG